MIVEEGHLYEDKIFNRIVEIVSVQGNSIFLKNKGEEEVLEASTDEIEQQAFCGLFKFIK